MMKYILTIFFLGTMMTTHAQIKTDTANGIYVGKMKYKWTGKEAQYKFQFPCDFTNGYWIVTDQLCNPFPYRQDIPFHNLLLADKKFRIHEGVYLMKNDTLYNATLFYDRCYLEDVWWDGESNCFPNWETDYKKEIWYDANDQINKNVWSKFKNYQLVAVKSDYDSDFNVIARFIFISKPLK